MALGTVKGKVVAGVVTVGLLSGIGTAFANTDAGGQLQNWYNTKYGQATHQSATDLYRHAAGQVNGLVAEKNKLKNDTVASVNQAGIDEVARANGNINTVANGYIDAINNKQDTLEAGMPAQFDSFVDGTTAYANGIVDVEAGKAQSEITTAVNNQGTTSLNQVTTDVTAAKNSAIASLEKEIASAKEELQSLLDSEKETASVELKANFNAKIQEVRTTITGLVAKLEAEKKQAIIDEGKQIENEAKAALDGLVSGIDGQ
jgi:hypothetical protein